MTLAQQAAAMRARGLEVKSIAVRLGYSRKTVERWLRDAATERERLDFDRALAARKTEQTL